MIILFKVNSPEGILSMNAIKIVQPTFSGKGFTCPICGTYAHMTWSRLQPVGWNRKLDYAISRCARCEKLVLWHEYIVREENGNVIPNGVIIHPPVSTAPHHHVDLPEPCVAEYDEARSIVGASPRGAAALLRLCLENLCAHLTGSAKNSINDNIAQLVREGLSVRIQQALDYLRVAGNNAVHPGTMDLHDTPDRVFSMFDLINLIVENQITQPRAVEALYNQIPEGARNAVERRDAQK